ncbi:MAG: glutamate racemase [Anaerolineae bacterium]|nr:glutamate racemase [Anaerolineae bacterium]
MTDAGPLDDDVRGSIGIFDSGVGGLSILRAVAHKLPYEDLIYIADSANCPYGDKPPEQVRRFSAGIVAHLVGRGAKLIVVACNTASGVALEYLRLTSKLPFVGMVPAVKPAAEITRTGVVGVLATPNTLSGRLYRDVVEHFSHGARILAQPCDGLAECVELGDLDGPGTLALLRRYIEPLLEAGADTLVLGCTHYTFLIPAIRRMVGLEVQVVEPSEAIARRVASLLTQQRLIRPETAAGRVHCATTGYPGRFAMQLEQLIGHVEPVEQLLWLADKLTVPESPP